MNNKNKIIKKKISGFDLTMKEYQKLLEIIFYYSGKFTKNISIRECFGYMIEEKHKELTKNLWEKKQKDIG